MSIGIVSRRVTATVFVLCTFNAIAWPERNIVDGADKSVKLSGCLIRGEGDGDGYLLTNPPNEPALASPDRRISPSALGTSGDFATVFYWLDRHGDLRQHIGHRVEIQGELKGDVKDGEIEVDRKDNWTELTIKADGRTMKARVPNTSLFPAANREDDRKGHVLVRRVDVERVRMLGASCG